MTSALLLGWVVQENKTDNAGLFLAVRCSLDVGLEGPIEEKNEGSQENGWREGHDADS